LLSGEGRKIKFMREKWLVGTLMIYYFLKSEFLGLLLVGQEIGRVQKYNTRTDYAHR